MAKIFLVMGSAGSEPEFYDWPICYYNTEIEAELHCLMANDRQDALDAMDWKARGELRNLYAEDPEVPNDGFIRNACFSFREISYGPVK